MDFYCWPIVFNSFHTGTFEKHILQWTKSYLSFYSGTIGIISPFTNTSNGVYIQFRQSFTKETYFYDEQLKSYENKYWKSSMRERKKNGVHGTLQMILLAWKLNSKQLLCKILNSRMNIIETRAVLNIIQKDGKCAPEAKREGLELIRRCFLP